MNRLRSKRRSNIGLSLLLLAWLSSPAATAADLSLRPFSASYDLYEGGMHLAVSELSLEQLGEDWRWVMVTRARGIFAMFTNKQHYAETRFTRFDDHFLLTEIRLGEHGGENNNEIALFDWAEGRLDVLRKGKRSEQKLYDGVYDYQSIHLLAASMGQSQLDRPIIDFYRKGKLVKSHFVYSGQKTVDVGGNSIDANVYEQVVSRSKSRIRYYYDARNPLLPLRIEKLEPGETQSILALREVDWGL